MEAFGWRLFLGVSGHFCGVDPFFELFFCEESEGDSCFL
jgi:hypothetical protein